MTIVILAGGIGSRLWPLSTPDCPKYLLRLIGDKTMIQHVFVRAEKLTNADKIFVITDQKNKPKIAEQLPELSPDNILPIPVDRGTATSIVMALDALNRRFEDKNETIAFIHADHAIADTEGFVKSFHIADQMTQANSIITLVGVHPTYPATVFGYIEKGREIGDGFEVIKFEEKPDFATAEKYVQSGRYVWNAGYFIGSLRTFLETIAGDAPILQKTWDEFQKHGEILGRDYNETFADQPSEQIDTALIEKASRLLVVPAEFDWSDIGSFRDLHEILPSDEKGNHVEGADIYTDEISNTFVRNDESGTPIAVIGVDNIAVVNTKGGILIARRDLSKNIGQIAKRINNKKKEEK